MCEGLSFTSFTFYLVLCFCLLHKKSTGPNAEMTFIAYDICKNMLRQQALYMVFYINPDGYGYEFSHNRAEIYSSTVVKIPVTVQDETRYSIQSYS